MKNLVRQWVIRYNNRFPLDRWWREKHNIPFNSSNHREITPVDVKFEYEEDRLFKELAERREKEDKRKEDLKNNGWINVQEESLSEDEDNELFEKIDIDKLNQQLNGE